jgi:hypothetical protein
MLSKKKRRLLQAVFDPVGTIAKFVDELIGAVRAGQVMVEELCKTEHGLSSTTGYKCTFRNVNVVIGRGRVVVLDGTPIGPEILDSPLTGAHVDRFTLLWADFTERHINQELDSKDELTARDEKANAALRAKAYAGLAAKLNRR